MYNSVTSFCPLQTLASFKSMFSAAFYYCIFLWAHDRRKTNHSGTGMFTKDTYLGGYQGDQIRLFFPQG
jgi:hypothetical protein